MRIMCKTFSPTFCKGHFKDELYDLLKKYRDSNYFNIRRDVSVYMNEITLWELSNEMGMSMYCGVNTKPRFCNYELKIDNLYFLQRLDMLYIDQYKLLTKYQQI